MQRKPNPALVKLGDAIRSRREELGLSQETVSFQAGIDRSYLSQVETGARNPSYLVLVEIAKALSSSLKALLPDEE